MSASTPLGRIERHADMVPSEPRQERVRKPTAASSCSGFSSP